MKTVRNYTVLVIGLALSLSLGMGTALAAAPNMITTAASSITNTSAVLNGSFTPQNSGATDVRFEYGTTNAFGNFTSYMRYNGATSFSDTITGLATNTTYFYRTFGVNADGPAYGNTLSFTTGTTSLANVITTYATSVTANSATLNGSFTSNGSATTYTWFEYANNASFVGSSTTNQQTAGGTYGALSQTVYNLSPNTTYYFRAMAQTSVGIAYGTPVLTFTTSGGSNNGACSINSFYPAGNSYTVTSGSSTTLYWNTTGCTNTSISTIGAVYPATSGSTSTGAIYGLTTYTLTATDTYGNTVTRQVTISTNSNNNSSSCTISSFYPTYYSVASGSSTMLNWATSGCNNITISNIGSGYSYTGSVSTGAIYANTTYTLTATDTYGNSVNRYTTVSVGNTNNTNGNYNYCQITGLVANDPSVTNGGTTNLYYTTTGCTSVSISGGPVNNSNLATSGTVFVGPLYASTTYTLSAYGTNSVTRQITVSVGNFLTNMWNNWFGNNQQPTDSTYYPPVTTTQTVVGDPIIRYVDGGTVTSGTNTVAVQTTNINGVEWGNHFPTNTMGMNNPNSVLGASVISSGFMGMPFSGWIVILLIIIGIILIARLILGRRY